MKESLYIFVNRVEKSITEQHVNLNGDTVEIHNVLIAASHLKEKGIVTNAALSTLLGRADVCKEIELNKDFLENLNKLAR